MRGVWGGVFSRAPRGIVTAVPRHLIHSQPRCGTLQRPSSGTALLGLGCPSPSLAPSAVVPWCVGVPRNPCHPQPAPLPTPDLRPVLPTSTFHSPCHLFRRGGKCSETRLDPPGRCCRAGAGHLRWGDMGKPPSIISRTSMSEARSNLGPSSSFLSPSRERANWWLCLLQFKK